MGDALASGLLAAILCTCLGMGCAKRRVADPRTDILAVMDAQVAAWNRGDIEGFLEGYWRSPELLFASRGRFSKGWAALLARYREGYPEGRMGTLRFDDIEIHALDSDWAWVVGTWWLEQASAAPHGAFTLIWRRTSDGWRIVHDHSSGVPEEPVDERQD